MDMLYRAYSNPLDLMNIYINQGRFGKFVTGFLEAEYERRKQEAEKDQDWKLWMMYINSLSDKNFSDWKDSVLQKPDSKKQGTKDRDLTDENIQSIITNLFPSE
jgi:hypothetical protein